MTILTPANSTAVISAQLSSAIQGPLQQASTFLSLPGIRIVNSSAPLRIPVSAATTPAAAFVAPGALISDSDVALTELDLLPSTRTSIKTLTKMSNEAIRQASLSLEAILTPRIVEDAGVVLDAALYNGDGSSNSISGILHGVTPVVDADTLTDPDVLINTLAVMAETHVSPNVLVMRPTTYAALRTIKVGATDNRYVIDPSAAFATGTQNLLGLPVVLTTNAPANSVVILDATKIFVARDGDSVVTVLDQTFGDHDSIGVRTVSRYDVIVTKPQAVKILASA